LNVLCTHIGSFLLTQRTGVLIAAALPNVLCEDTKVVRPRQDFLDVGEIPPK